MSFDDLGQKPKQPRPGNDSEPKQDPSSKQQQPTLDQEQHEISTIDFDGIRTRIADAVPGHVTHVATIWGTPSFNQDPARAAMRPDKGEFRGTFTDGNDRMPYVGFWLSGADNKTFLVESEDITLDPSVIKWFRNAGISGEWVGTTHVDHMADYLRKTDSRLYSCDNYGAAIDPFTVNSREDFDLVSNKSWSASICLIPSSLKIYSSEFVAALTPYTSSSATKSTAEWESSRSRDTTGF
jgi:hypothetical protein